MNKILIYTTIVSICLGCASSTTEKSTGEKSRITIEHALLADYENADLAKLLSSDDWLKDWKVWFDTMPGQHPRFFVVKKFGNAHELQLIKRAVGKTSSYNILILRVVKRDFKNPDPYNRFHVMDEIRFEELHSELKTPYTNVAIELPNRRILVISHITKVD